MGVTPESLRESARVMRETHKYHPQHGLVVAFESAANEIERIIAERDAAREDNRALRERVDYPLERQLAAATARADSESAWAEKRDADFAAMVTERDAATARGDQWLERFETATAVHAGDQQRLIGERTKAETEAAAATARAEAAESDARREREKYAALKQLREDAACRPAAGAIPDGYAVELHGTTGRWAVMHHGKIIDDYPTREEAMDSFGVVGRPPAAGPQWAPREKLTGRVHVGDLPAAADVEGAARRIVEGLESSHFLGSKVQRARDREGVAARYDQLRDDGCDSWKASNQARVEFVARILREFLEAK